MPNRQSSSFFPPSESSATSPTSPSRSALSPAAAGRARRAPEHLPRRAAAMDVRPKMPAEKLPRRILLVVTLMGATLLGGCALNGDFGRTRDELVTEDMHAWVGRDAARSIGGKPSEFHLTDNERRLRDLAYALIEPPYDRNG